MIAVDDDPSVRAYRFGGWLIQQIEEGQWQEVIDALGSTGIRWLAERPERSTDAMRIRQIVFAAPSWRAVRPNTARSITSCQRPVAIRRLMMPSAPQVRAARPSYRQ